MTPEEFLKATTPPSMTPEQFVGAASTDTLLNKARVFGTAGVEGVTNTLNVPSSVVGLAGKLSEAQQSASDWIRRQFGAAPRDPAFVKKLTERERGAGNAVSRALDVTPLVESVGLPTSYEAEGKRLGVDTSGWVGDVASGIRTVTGAATMGAGLPASLLMGAGAGVGRAVGGNVGEMAGAFLAPMAAPSVARMLTARANKPPTMAALSSKVDDAWDAFRATPAAVDSAAFGPFVRTVESRLAAHSGPLVTPPSALAEIGKKAAAAEASGAPITTKDLWQLRHDINLKLQSRALEPADKHVLKTLRKDIDDFLLAPKPAANVTGDWNKAVTHLREAIPATKRLKDSQQLEKLAQNAELSGRTWFGGSATLGNLNLHLRREFNKLIKSGEINKFAPDVQREIRKAASFGLPRSALEVAGKFAPTSVIPGAAAGYAHVSGDENAWWLASLAMMSRVAANKMGAAQAQRAAAAARRATPAPKPPNPLGYLVPAYGAYLSQQ